MANPVVSIVVPIFNAEPYLRQALDSLIGQTLEDIEIICVNDGSTDASLSIIEEYAKRDHRVVVVDGPNGGYGKAMNRGLDQACGEYVGILEPDDYVLPHMCSKLVEYAEKYDLDFIRADFYRFTTIEDKEWERRTRELVCHGRSDMYRKVLNPQFDFDLYNTQMQNWTGITRRSFIEKYGIRFHESPGARFQDNSFWFQTYCWAERVMYLDRPFYCHRDDNPNSSTNRTDLMFAMLDEWKWIRDYLSRFPDREKSLIGVYQHRKFLNCNFAFSRLADELRLPYLERWSEENLEAISAGEVDYSYFSNGEREQFEAITSNPKAYLERYRAYRQSLIDEEREEEARKQGRRALFSFYLQEKGIRFAVSKTLKFFVKRARKN